MSRKQHHNPNPPVSGPSLFHVFYHRCFNFIHIFRLFGILQHFLVLMLNILQWTLSGNCIGVSDDDQRWIRAVIGVEVFQGAVCWRELALSNTYFKKNQYGGSL